MADRPVSSFTTTTDIDQEIARLADEIQEIELLHKNLQLVRKLLGSAISQAQSASKSSPVSTNNHTLNSTGITESSSSRRSCVGCTGPSTGVGVGSGEGVPVSSGEDKQRICACSADNCIRICVNPRLTAEMEQHFAAATAQQQQQQQDQRSPSPSPPPTPPGSDDRRDNGNMQSPPPPPHGYTHSTPPPPHGYTHSTPSPPHGYTQSSPPPQYGNMQSSPPPYGNTNTQSSSSGNGSTMAEFHVKRYPGLGSTAGSPGAPTSSGTGSTVAGFRLRRIPTNEQGQVVVGVPMPLNESPYSSYCNDNTDPTISSFQSNQQQLNYFQQQYPHINQHYQYSPQGQNNMTY